MEWCTAPQRAGYLLPVAAQLGHLDGPVGFGTLHAQGVAAAVGGEDRSPIGDVVGLAADAAVLAAHACAWLWSREVGTKMFGPCTSLLWIR